MFKNKAKLGKNFHFKDRVSKDLTSSVVYKFQCGLCSESIMVYVLRHLNVRFGEHIGISLLPKQLHNSSLALSSL